MRINDETEAQRQFGSANDFAWRMAQFESDCRVSSFVGIGICLAILLCAWLVGRRNIRACADCAELQGLFIETGSEFYGADDARPFMGCGA